MTHPAALIECLNIYIFQLCAAVIHKRLTPSYYLKSLVYNMMGVINHHNSLPARVLNN